MEKEALLNIIINDLKEVDLLMNTIKNCDAIDTEFLQLSMTKINQIIIEMKMLEKFVGQKKATIVTESALPSLKVPEIASVVPDEKSYTPPSEAESILRATENEVLEVIQERTYQTESLQEPKTTFQDQPLLILEELQPSTVIEPAIVTEAIAVSEPMLIAEATAVNEPSTSDAIQEIQPTTVTDDTTVVEHTQSIESETKEDPKTIILQKDIDTTNSPEPIEIKVIEERHKKEVEPKTQEVTGIEIQSTKDTKETEHKEITTSKSSAKEDVHILKDLLATNTKSVNEIMSEKKPQTAAFGTNIVVPVSNIFKAIGINDKMLFQRELFSNNGAKMNSTIDQLNEMKCYEDALTFIHANYDWNFEDAKVTNFLNIVKRRYI